MVWPSSSSLWLSVMVWPSSSSLWLEARP